MHCSTNSNVKCGSLTEIRSEIAFTNATLFAGIISPSVSSSCPPNLKSNATANAHNKLYARHRSDASSEPRLASAYIQIQNENVIINRLQYSTMCQVHLSPLISPVN